MFIIYEQDIHINVKLITFPQRLTHYEYRVHCAHSEPNVLYLLYIFVKSQFQQLSKWLPDIKIVFKSSFLSEDISFCIFLRSTYNVVEITK